MDWRQWMGETAFGRNTRQNIRSLNNFTYSSGQRESQAFPRTGYLARVRWHFAGTLTVTLGGGTAALDASGPWNALSRVRVNANSGTDIYNVSGYGSHLVNMLMTTFAQNYVPSDSGLPSAISSSARVYNAPTAGGANVWDFGQTIPIAVNDMSELGLVLLQNELASVALNFEYNSLIYSLTANQAPVLVTGAATATLTGAITPVIEYFSVPVDQAARPDITWLHQLLEITQPISAVGDNYVNHLRENHYLGIINYFILNNALNSADIDRMRFTFNNSDTPYDLPNKAFLQLQRERYHVDLPLGTFYWDFSYQGFPNFGGERDLVNGKATSELQTIATISASATLGTNASRINTITRQMVRLSGQAVSGV